MGHIERTKGYQIVTKKMKALPTIIKTDEKHLEIAKSLFPAHPRMRWKQRTVEKAGIPLFTKQELLQSARKVRNKKALGPDGISPGS